MTRVEFLVSLLVKYKTPYITKRAATLYWFYIVSGRFYDFTLYFGLVHLHKLCHNCPLSVVIDNYNEKTWTLEDAELLLTAACRICPR